MHYLYGTAVFSVLTAPVISELVISHPDPIHLYNGQVFTINCTISDQDSFGGQPEIIVEPHSNTQPNQSAPKFSSSRPNQYTIQATFKATKALNDYSIRCQNRTDEKTSFDKIFQNPVYYINEKPADRKTRPKDLYFNQTNTVTIDCYTYFETNHDIDYLWAGVVVNEDEKSSSITSYSKFATYGAHVVTCKATLKGDPTGLNHEVISFTLHFPDEVAPPNSVSRNAGNERLLWTVLILIHVLISSKTSSY